jgi:hypothetical protein
MDTQMPDGANLRETTLDRQDLIMIIKCGRPGTGMPAFDRLAYSDGRCYGLKQADLRASGKRIPDPPATLQVREVEAIADFLAARKSSSRDPWITPNASNSGARKSKPVTSFRNR